jgi:hypothetical protein
MVRVSRTGLHPDFPLENQVKLLIANDEPAHSSLLMRRPQVVCGGIDGV